MLRYAVELFSAAVVPWGFRASAARGDAERRAVRAARPLLFALATFVAVTSVTSLGGYGEPKPTFLEIALLGAAAVIMPWLAKEKRRPSGATDGAALRADLAQSARCAYLSLISLAGPAINAIWHARWQNRLRHWWFCFSLFGRVEKPPLERVMAVARFGAANDLWRSHSCLQ